MPQYHCSPDRRDMHKLSCYHRNLTLVTLHTEMLAQVIVSYTDVVDRGETASASFKALAKSAAIRLGYLYSVYQKGSKKYTYTSASPRYYLDEHGYVALVNRVRKEFGMQELSYTPR